MEELPRFILTERPQGALLPLLFDSSEHVLPRAHTGLNVKRLGSLRKEPGRACVFPRL